MFKKPFSFNGRIRRLEYGISFIIYMILVFFSEFLFDIYTDLINNGAGEQSISSIIGILSGLLALSVWWFICAQNTKRCHDLGKSGWWQFIPFYVIWLIFQKGQERENNYGKNPKSVDHAKGGGNALNSQTGRKDTNIVDSKGKGLENKEISVTPTLDFDRIWNDTIDRAKAKGIDPDVVDSASKYIRDYFEKATHDSNDRSMLFNSLRQLGVDLNGGTLISHVIADDEKKPVSNMPSLNDSREKLTSSNITETEAKDKLEDVLLRKVQIKWSSLSFIHNPIIAIIAILYIFFFYSTRYVTNYSKNAIKEDSITVRGSVYTTSPTSVTFYNMLTAQGVELGTYLQFTKNLYDVSKRKAFYNWLIKEKMPVGSWANFNSRMGYDPRSPGYVPPADTAPQRIANSNHKILSWNEYKSIVGFKGNSGIGIHNKMDLIQKQNIHIFFIPLGDTFGNQLESYGFFKSILIVAWGLVILALLNFLYGRVMKEKFKILPPKHLRNDMD